MHGSRELQQQQGHCHQRAVGHQCSMSYGVHSTLLTQPLPGTSAAAAARKDEGVLLSMAALTYSLQRLAACDVQLSCHCTRWTALCHAADRCTLVSQHAGHDS